MSEPQIPRCAHCGSLLRPIRGLPLTMKQAAIYAFLRERISANGYAPSLEEIARHFGYSTLATVHEHLQSLERKGWIRRRYNEARSIALTEDEQFAARAS